MAANKPLYIAIATVLAQAVLVAASVALAACLGLYSVTATREHPQVLYRFLHFAMRRSVSARAGGIPVPAQGEAGGGEGMAGVRVVLGDQEWRENDSHAGLGIPLG